jgi:uncharacterized protein YyaL (SSP411 family)
MQVDINEFKNFNTNRNYFYLVFLLLFLISCDTSNKNRLANASSPYLQQHADNPVDWYEWSDEALQLAKKENKPLLISIGYASCHWCHVMEKESFMDTAVARIMNENFVCIKVDREERPDIDNIYINACQLISGNSGWPLNAFALPDGKPFFAGTYYSKPSWISLLNKISTAYKNQNKKLVLQAQALTNGIVESDLLLMKPDSNTTAITKHSFQNLFDTVYSQMDTINGGLKGSPKFPMPSSLEFLLQYHHLTGNKNALNVVITTLTKMAIGGIYDHVGGGFARYATDSLWRIPHFEKMLYDNGQLMSVYAHAYKVTKNDLFKNVVKEIASFVQRDLRSPQGGFYSSLNADTKSGEGEFYAWNYNEVQKITGEKNADVVSDYFNISEQGNWKESKNILYASYTPAEFALKNNLSAKDFDKVLNTSKTTLLSERNKRDKPATDDKILTSWNALMLKGFIDAYAAIGEESYLNIALSNAGFIEKNLMDSKGHLWRNYKDGRASVNAFLDDYALLARAFIRLYQVTFDKHWLILAQRLTDDAIKNFYDPRSGFFFYTSHGSQNVVVRKFDITDNVIPSSNAIMAEVLYCLNTYSENENYLDKSSAMLSRISGQINSGTAFYTQWCFVAGMFSHGTYEIAIMGKDATKKNIELQKTYLPECLFMGSTEEENLPLLQDKMPVNKTLIYVCTNKTCKIPVEEVGIALRQLSKQPVKSF